MKRIQQLTSGLTLTIKACTVLVHPNTVGKREAGPCPGHTGHRPRRGGSKACMRGPRHQPRHHKEFPSDGFCLQREIQCFQKKSDVSLLIPQHLGWPNNDI